MGRYKVKYRVTKKGVGIQTRRVSTSRDDKDPMTQKARDNIRAALAPNYDVPADLIELIEVASMDGKKVWNKEVDGQDANVVDAVEAAGTAQKTTSHDPEIIPPSFEEILGVTARNQLELVIAQFDKEDALADTIAANSDDPEANWRLMDSETLAPFVAATFYPEKIPELFPAADAAS